MLGYDKRENIINYNITANPSDKLFPNSKELTFIFSKIKLEKFEEYNGQDIENGEYLKSNSITLTGEWKFKFEVPEKMYNRISHVTNSKGKKFKMSNLFWKEEFIDKDKYDFFNTFEMSKIDATDKITVTLIYSGEPVEIELEKVK